MYTIWNSSRQSDPSILHLHFSPNNLGLKEGKLVSLLTRLDLHGSSQASDEVGIFPSASFSLHLARFLKRQGIHYWYCLALLSSARLVMRSAFLFLVHFKIFIELQSSIGILIFIIDLILFEEVLWWYAASSMFCMYISLSLLWCYGVMAQPVLSLE